MASRKSGRNKIDVCKFSENGFEVEVPIFMVKGDTTTFEAIHEDLDIHVSTSDINELNKKVVAAIRNQIALTYETFIKVEAGGEVNVGKINGVKAFEGKVGLTYYFVDLATFKNGSKAHRYISDPGAERDWKNPDYIVCAGFSDFTRWSPGWPKTGERIESFSAMVEANSLVPYSKENHDALNAIMAKMNDLQLGLRRLMANDAIQNTLASGLLEFSAPKTEAPALPSPVIEDDGAEKA